MDTHTPGASAPLQAVKPAVFQFHSTEVRTIDRDGQIWFIAGDIAKALNYADAVQMTRVLDDDEAALHSVQIRSENGTIQTREVTIISESGLYHALLKSRKPEARAFRRWVTQEVLPAIRRGSLREVAPRQGLGTRQGLAPRHESGALSFLQGRFLLTFDLDGKACLQPLPEDACILSPSDPLSMATLIREILPRDRLAVCLQIGIERLAQQKMPKNSEPTLSNRHHPGREA